jgi:CheY-like chemotaxis protein
MNESTPRILVVDDEPNTCRYLASILGTDGFDVDTATDGSAALQLAQAHNYQVAVLDYQMPGMNGVELFKEMQQLQPHMIGIFLTAYPTIDTVFPAIESGIRRVLAKPVDPVNLARVINECLAVEK